MIQGGGRRGLENFPPRRPVLIATRVRWTRRELRLYSSACPCNEKRGFGSGSALIQAAYSRRSIRREISRRMERLKCLKAALDLGGFRLF
jgi:hypothetical protein